MNKLLLPPTLLLLTPIGLAQSDPAPLASAELDWALREAAGQTASGESAVVEASAMDAAAFDAFFQDGPESRPSVEGVRTFGSTAYTDASYSIVHPITSPNYADDAMITTDVRATFLNQSFPRSQPVDGGSARVYDAQARYAVNERFQVFLSRFGAADNHLVAGNPEYDITDAAVGVKYALVQDFANRTHVAVGAGYEFGIGDEDTFGGDDEIRLFGAWTQGVGLFNFNLAANLLLATGSETANGDSDRLFLHGHADYALDDVLSAVVELNYYRTLSNDDQTVTPFSGIDLASFGGAEGEDVLVSGIGGELRGNRNLRLRLAWESPLSSNVDLFGWRWTASAIWTF